MSDQEEDKKNLDEEQKSSEQEKQSEVDQNNQLSGEQTNNNETTSEGTENNDQNNDNLENLNFSNEKKEENINLEIENQEKSTETIISETVEDKKEENGDTSHQVIHKKDGRLHIYVRQDKYKGELKSKNWVGRLYIDGKQKISSSGTTNLDDAIPILEKWFDDVHKESERLKNQSKEIENTNEEVVTEPNTSQEIDPVVNETSTAPKSEPIVTNQINENQNKDETTTVASNEKPELTKQEEIKGKISNIFGKLKDIKFKKPAFANNSNKTSFNKSKLGGFKSKSESVLKSKLGKSTVQGEEILGVELANKEIRLVQVSSNKANQWVLDKLYIHPVDITDESTPIENADKFTEELSLAIQKYKISSPNVAISIPVTSAIIRVVTAPLMKDEELNKAIETNSLWENLVQLTDNLEDYSIFHQVINRSEKENTMDILFVASKLTDINSYTSIIKNAGLNPVIIDVKCFALKSAVDQSNQLTNKTEDANLTAVLEFG